MFLERIRSLQADREDIDGLIEMKVLGNLAVAEFKAAKLPVPDYLDDGMKTINIEIEAKRRDTLQRALKAAQLRRKGLATAEEKRNALDLEIQAIESALGAPVAQPSTQS